MSARTTRRVADPALGKPAPQTSSFSPITGLDPTRSVGDGTSAIISFTAALTDSRFSDVTFVVNGREFNAHRCILAARSEVFCGMLFGGMRESVEKRIEVPDSVDADIFAIILEWAYTGMARMSARDVLGVLKLANFYGFPDLEEHCRTLALSFIDEPNVVSLLDSAIEIGEEEIVAQSLKFIQMNPGATVGHPSWLTLCKTGVEQVLSLKELNCGECLLFDRTMDWIVHNAEVGGSDPNAELESRNALLSCLLPHIRLPQMSVKDLLEKVRPLVSTTKVHFQEYVHALEYKLSPQTFFSDRGIQFCPREPSFLGKIVQKVPYVYLDGWMQLVEVDACLPLPEDTFRDINQFSTTYICVGERSRNSNVISLMAVGNIDIALRKSTNQAQFFPDGAIYWCNSTLQNVFGFASVPDQRPGQDLPASERDKKLMWPLSKKSLVAVSGSASGQEPPQPAEAWLSGGSNQRVRFICVK